MKKIWDFIEDHPWIPLLISIIAFILSLIVFAITIGFRIAML